MKKRKFNPQVMGAFCEVVAVAVNARLEELGMTIEELAERSQLPIATVIRIAEGKADYSVQEFVAVFGSLRGRIFFEFADIDSVAGFNWQDPSYN